MANDWCCDLAKASKLLRVDDSHDTGPATGDEDLRLVRRDGDTEGSREVALKFVDGYLDSLAGIFAEDCERIDEGPSVFYVGEWDQILRLKLRDNAELSVV